MAEDTVRYHAKSVVITKTWIVNILAIAVAALSSDEIRALLGPNALVYVTAFLGVANMLIRWLGTVRPAAMMLPGSEKIVHVAKL